MVILTLDKYLLCNGTYYNEGTHPKVIVILENAKADRQKIRLYYGDSKTGEDWCETFDVIGYIGRSTGPIKVPLILATMRSMGGPAISTQTIVKITVGGTVLWQHEEYHIPELVSCLVTGKWAATHRYGVRGKDGDILASFSTEKERTAWLDFLNGKTDKKEF